MDPGGESAPGHDFRPVGKLPHRHSALGFLKRASLPASCRSRGRLPCAPAAWFPGSAPRGEGEGPRPGRPALSSWQRNEGLAPAKPAWTWPRSSWTNPRTGGINGHRRIPIPGTRIPGDSCLVMPSAARRFHRTAGHPSRFRRARPGAGPIGGNAPRFFRFALRIPLAFSPGLVL